MTRQSSNGSRAAGSRRRASGSTAIASASFSGPRRPGIFATSPGASSGLRAEATWISPAGSRTAADQWVGPWISRPLRSAMPPSRSRGGESFTTSHDRRSRFPPVDLLLIAIWSFAVALAGGVAGLVLGNLRLPLLLQFSSSTAAGAGANVGVSAASALTATIAHWRGGRIDWPLFWLMAPPSLLGGIAGGVLSGLLPQRLLLAVIAVVVLYGALELGRRRQRPIAAEPGAGGRRRALAIAFAVGVLGGLVGLILGSLRLPAMVRWLGTTPRAAVGTNAATGVVVGIGGLIGHLNGGIDWNLLAAGCAGAVPGAYFGAQLTGRLDDEALLRVVALVLVLAGLSLAAQAIFS